VREAIRQRVEAALGSPVRDVRAVGGGDVNEDFRARLADGRDVFVKRNADAPEGLFEAEARGLRWLAEAAALRVPEVLACAKAGEPAFLVLEHLESRPPAAGFDEALGRGLAALHRFGADRHGLDHDNFIGRLPQDNRPGDDWPTFYRERRLEPQLARARDGGLESSRMRAGFERVLTRLDELCGPGEPPSRLHGDLWGGNLMSDELGRPALVDPAVYGGDREVDLAMMRLFGGFSPRVFDAYAEAFPLRPGAAERVTLYQLYPLAVHVNHFGGHYVASLERALEAIA
jgi:fructosamine-3-kinase